MKKNTVLFILIASYCIAFMIIMALLDEKALQIKLVLLITSLFFVFFSRILKNTGKINWLTNYSYEDYEKMSSELRLEIASEFAKKIAFPNFLFCSYQLISICFCFNIFIDILCFLICLFIMCFKKVKVN